MCGQIQIMNFEWDERKNETNLDKHDFDFADAFVLVYTESDEATIHIISLRKALSHERKRYEQYLKNRLV